MTIYIIDDNEIDLIIGQKMLERRNSDLHIEVCQNPELALEQILKGVIRADVILLDWFMPLMPAEQWLKRYSEQEQITIPVYILTSSVNPIDRQKAEAFAIVEGFFSKPLQQHHIDKILHHLSDRKQ